jgi:hypothetical protein
MRRVDGAAVILRGPEQERRATTVNGQYEFTGLPPGAYSVSVTMPDGLPAARSARPPEDPSARYRFDFHDEREHTQRLTIADARACSYAPFEAQFDGEVSGTVVSHDGTPPGQQTVELFPTTVDPQQRDEGAPAAVYSDEGGTFRISHVPPGRYIVGINLRHGASDRAPFPPTFYRQPGTDEPLIIELGDGTHMKLGALHLPPPLTKRQIAGTVTWSDGRPLGDVLVKVCEAGSKRLRVYCDTHGLRDDEFSAEVFAGTTYTVRAEAVNPRGSRDMATDAEIPPIGTAEVTVFVDGDVNGLRLVLVPRLDRR